MKELCSDKDVTNYLEILIPSLTPGDFFPHIFVFLEVSSGGKSGFRILCVTLGVFFWTVIENSTKVSFCILENFYFLKFEQGADLGRSRLVQQTFRNCTPHNQPERCTIRRSVEICGVNLTCNRQDGTSKLCAIKHSVQIHEVYCSLSGFHGMNPDKAYKWITNANKQLSKTKKNLKNRMHSSPCKGYCTFE